MKLGFKRNTATIGVSPVPLVGGVECTVDAVTQVEISEASVQTTFEIVNGEFLEARVDDITVPDINVDIRITSLSGDGLCDRSVSGDVKQQLNNLLEKLSTFTDLVASETREKVRDAARAAIRDALSDVRFKVPLYASVVSETKHAGEISAGQKLLGAGTDCWGNCDSRAGPCSACGEMGACCKAGERDRFCNIPACRPICASWVPIIGCIWSTYSPSNLPCDHHTCTINSDLMLRVEQWADPVRGVVGFQAHLGRRLDLQGHSSHSHTAIVLLLLDATCVNIGQRLCDVGRDTIRMRQGAGRDLRQLQVQRDATFRQVL